jgi:hypothetical protein
VAAPRSFEGALAVDEPVPLVGPLCGEDAHIGQVPWNLNDVVHSDSHREPVPRLSLQGAPSRYDTCSPSRQFRESQMFPIRHRSYLLRLAIGIEANLLDSVVGQI